MLSFLLMAFVSLFLIGVWYTEKEAPFIERLQTLYFSFLAACASAFV